MGKISFSDLVQSHIDLVQSHSALKGASEHMATHAQLQELRCEIYKKMCSDLKWIVCTLGLVAIIVTGGLGLIIKPPDIREPQRQTSQTIPMPTPSQAQSSPG